MNTATKDHQSAASSHPGARRDTAGADLTCSMCLTARATCVCAECARFLCKGCSHDGSWWARAKHAAALPRSVEKAGGSVFCERHKGVALSPTALGGVLLLSTGAWSWLSGNGAMAIPSLALAALLAFNKRSIDRHLPSLWGPRGPTAFGVRPHYEITIAEDVDADFVLDRPGNGYVTPPIIRGTLRVYMRTALDPEDDRTTKDIKSDTLHAGFIAFSAEQPISSDDASFVGHPATHCASLLLGKLPAGFDPRSPKQRPLGKEWSYRCQPRAERVRDDDEPSRWVIPLRLLPSYGQSRLNPRIWGLTLTCSPDVSRLVITELCVQIPPQLESVQRTDGVVDHGNMQVVWHDIVVTPSTPGSIVIEFDQPIHATSVILASYSARIDNHLQSGLKWDPSRLWYASGLAVDQNEVSEKRSTRLQGTISVPTRLQPKFQEVIVRRRELHEGLALDVQLAHRAIRELARHDLYAKDVAASHEEGSLGSRYWEVVGRQYVGHQPYDVHIILSDDEEATAGEAIGNKKNSVVIELVVRVESQLPFVETDTRDAHALSEDVLTTVRQSVQHGVSA